MVEFVQAEADGDDGVFILVIPIFDIGGGNDGPLGQQFHSRIPTITGATKMVQQFDSITPFLPLKDVVVGADPGHEMSSAGTAGGLISKADYQFAIGREDFLVTIPVSPQGVSTGVDQVSPSSSLNIIRLCPL